MIHSSFHSHRIWQFFKIVMGIAVLAGGIFLVLTVISAYAIRSTIQAQLAVSQQQTEVLRLINLNSGWNWSHFKLGLGDTATIIDIQIKHWGLFSYIQGRILNFKINPMPLANFSGYVDSQPWLESWHWNVELHGLGGNWSLPFGLLELQPMSLHVQVYNTLQNADFVMQAELKELYYQSILLIRAAPINLRVAGNFKINAQPNWDVIFNLTANSNYGPVKFLVDLLSPSSNLIHLVYSGQIRLRGVLPISLWDGLKLWQPMLVQSLVSGGMFKQQAGVVILSVMWRDGKFVNVTMN